jgi:hypothetical protein
LHLSRRRSSPGRRSPHGLARDDRVKGVAALFQNAFGARVASAFSDADGKVLTAHDGTHVLFAPLEPSS